jgi:hypothetical protein
MLNFYRPFLCRVLAAILKMADILKILKTQNCSSNGDLSDYNHILLFLFLFSFLSADHELVHGRSQELLDSISWNLVEL